MTRKVSGTITVKNDQPTETTLTLEPWGDECRIRFDGPDDIRVEIVSEPGGLVVWGWTGSVMEFAR